jgi:hypothetical protein
MVQESRTAPKRGKGAPKKRASAAEPPGERPSPSSARGPDRLVFACLTLVIAGVVATLYGLVVMAGWANIGTGVLAFIRDYPAWLTVLGGLTAAVGGGVGFRTQRSLPAWVGVAGAVASMGLLGVAAGLGLVAAVMLGLSLAAGEERALRGQPLAAAKWPDKAHGASLLLTVGALCAGAQGVMVLLGSMEPMLLRETPLVWGAFSLVAAGAMLVGAVRTFRLMGGRTGLAAAALGFASFSFYFAGPVLALLAANWIRLAYREGEFTPERAAHVRRKPARKEAGA